MNSMAVISFNKDAKGERDSITIQGNEEEIEKIVNYVKHMYDKPIACVNDDEDIKEDMINHPSHYTKGIECIDEMILLYGVVETMSFCKLNAHKYRKRAFDKGGKADQDKSDWYMKEYAYLDSKSDFEVKDEIYKKYDLNNN